MRRGFVGLVLLASLGVMVLAGAAGAVARGDELAAVRAATAKYHQLSAAEHAGYGVFYVCTDQPGQGAMGQHYVNGDLVGDAVLDPARPEAVIYEPQADGSSKLVGVEWVVFQDTWENAGNQEPPKLFGKPLKLVPSPNRYGIPSFYQIHAWIWKHNPAGSFSDWNPTVSCRNAPN
jgi:hypothetical protein